MIFTVIIFGVLAFLYLCWLLFTMAIYATPFFVGTTAAMAAYNTDAGLFGAIVVGFAAGVAIYVLGQAAIYATRSPMLRLTIILLFVLPAPVAGYHAALGLARLGAPSEVWHHVFAAVGALVVGATAWARMAYPDASNIGISLAAGAPPRVIDEDPLSPSTIPNQPSDASPSDRDVVIDSAMSCVRSPMLGPPFCTPEPLFLSSLNRASCTKGTMIRLLSCSRMLFGPTRPSPPL